MSDNKISVLVLTQNNEATLERTLKSVSGFDEIIVVDGGSKDQTIAIAQKYKAKIIHHTFKSFSEQRNISLEHAKYDWCLVVDSDEEVTPELKEELYRRIQTETKFLLYRIVRTEYLLGRENKYGYNRSFYQERFFNKKHTKYVGELHESPLLDGRKLKFKDPRTCNLPKEFRLHHNPENNISMILERFPKYSILKAKEKIAKGKKVNLLELVTCFPLSFLQILIRRWRAGQIAILESLMEAAARMFVKILIYEDQILRKKKN